VLSGAAKYKACAELGITIRTYQRWMAAGGIKSDGRPDSVRPIPKNKLTLAGRKRLLDTMNSETYKSLPASQMVPALADEGIYLASESTATACCMKRSCSIVVAVGKLATGRSL
jgi:putative transposase